VTYRFYADLEEPGRFCVFEIWESGAALQAHFEAPHMATFRATLAKLTIVSRNVVRYEVAGAEKL